MDLRTYLERRGDRLGRSNPELLRLAGEIGVSSEVLYMVALGHKRLGLRRAIALVDCTRGEIEGNTLCADYPASMRPARQHGKSKVA